MSFSYELYTEEEALKYKGFPMLPDGIYDFSVLESKFTYTAKGNPAINLKLSIIHDGEEFLVWDTLASARNMAWKIQHFCQSTGLDENYRNRTFNELLASNKRGRVLIGYQPERPNPQGGVYKARNVVEDYIGSEVKTNGFSTPKEKEKGAVDPQFNDNLPF